MKIRSFLAYFQLMNFLIMIITTLYLLIIFWKQVETWNLILNIYYVIMGLSGVVLALWIATDGKRLECYSNNIKNFEKKILTLEQKIKKFKPLSQNNGKKR